MCVEPTRVQLKLGASAVKAKPKRYDSVKTSWLASCVAALLAFGVVFRNLQAVWPVRRWRYLNKTRSAW